MHRRVGAEPTEQVEVVVAQVEAGSLDVERLERGGNGGHPVTLGSGSTTMCREHRTTTPVATHGVGGLIKGRVG